MSTAENTVQPGQHYTVVIEKVTHGGAGLANLHGMSIFVEDAIPGQEVEIVVTKKKENFAEAQKHKGTEGLGIIHSTID